MNKQGKCFEIIKRLFAFYAGYKIDVKYGRRQRRQGQRRGHAHGQPRGREDLGRQQVQAAQGRRRLEGLHRRRQAPRPRPSRAEPTSNDRLGGYRDFSPDKLSPPMFSKVLVANRGEIAIRVFRALRELDIQSVAVYSEADADAPFVKYADEAYSLGEGPASDTYLVVDKIIDVAKRSGAEAVHPGYGFLAENSAFAQTCQDEALVFIGPPPSAIDAMGSKTNSRELMKAAGVPIVPGTTEPVETVEDAKKIIDAEIGYPIAVKAAGGGGGKGFRVALTEDELADAFEGAAREGEKFFGDPHRLPRALPAQPAPRRGPDHRRQRGQHRAPRRARLLGPAPPPETDRRGARAGGRRSPARAHGHHRHRGRACRRLPLGRHDRGPAARRRVLLPRDEHPRPGRALRD